MLSTIKIKPINLVILLNILLILISLIIFNKTNIDLNFQKFFFDFERQKWLIDKKEPIGRFWFYHFPKILLGISITLSLLVLALSFYKKLPHHQLLIFFLGITLIPLTVGNIKKFTNIYCPDQLIIYDGYYPYVKILEPYPADFIQTKHGKCFPGGHAVTGFCLMILFFVFKKKSRRICGLLFGLTMGWILGFYQIVKGAHFLSDTFITMLCCFLLATIIAKFAKPRDGLSSNSLLN